MVNNSRQIKTKKRVVDHGEVFTADREVQSMCDLVKEETSRIDSRFLEPACGDGNFLSEILKRKLTAVKNQYGRYVSDYEKYSFVAVSSIYGIDILDDNVIECRKRLYDIWDEAYTSVSKNNANEECRLSIKYVLSKNIICGDALTLLDSTGKPIVFSEWSLLGTQIKRRDYTMANLVETRSYYDLPLLQETQNEDVIIPKPIQEFPLTAYRSIYKHG